ncbi:MAG: 3-dehydroquinate dehydratase [Chloroflexi bacterium]|nr:3-dehydroquinate dehydratase [Chloroflexota bacterium]|tara:strand:+ start:597 stop:1037 length:441 start_codon:yes stop_codon:yes gene_type:complete
MKKILLINGPNLNNLGNRESKFYGNITLQEIESEVIEVGKNHNLEIQSFQSNHEGDIVDFIQKNSKNSIGIIINPGALTSSGYSLVDAIIDSNLTTIEVHLSNIHAREKYRSSSIIAPISKGQISGLGKDGYIFALNYFIPEIISE